MERKLTLQNFSKAKPVNDQTFAIYRSMYQYERTPLHAEVRQLPLESKDWRREKAVVDTAYGKERLPVFLFLPTRAKPPYQAVIFFPTARAFGAQSSERLEDRQYLDFILQSGRAVIYPVYKGTYERPSAAPVGDTAAGRDSLIMASKDFQRTIDYLQTRNDIDVKRIAYMGVSMGAAVGVILASLEERLRTAIFLDGGFMAEKLLPGADQADFAPRLNVPTLLISGRFDWIFLGKDALLNLIGAPKEHKRAILFETAHDVSEQRADLIREVLAWLDRYLGKVE